MISKKGKAAIAKAKAATFSISVESWWKGYFAGMSNAQGVIGVAQDEALKAKRKSTK